jgi:hypothetical protein
MGYGRAYDGIGLGLALVKKLLDLNKAAIKVTIKKNTGTTFSIIFDKGETTPDEIKNKDIKEVNNTNRAVMQKKSILLVEDDLMNQVTIKRFLRDNYEITVTDSSDEAKEILKQGLATFTIRFFFPVLRDSGRLLF